MQLYNHFLNEFWDVNKFGELELDTGSLYFALAEKELEDCIQAEMKAEFEGVRSKDCTDSFTADAIINSFRQSAVTSTKNMTRESLDFPEKNSDVQRRCVYVATYFPPLDLLHCYSQVATNFTSYSNFSAKLSHLSY